LFTVSRSRFHLQHKPFGGWVCQYPLGELPTLPNSLAGLREGCGPSGRDKSGGGNEKGQEERGIGEKSDRKRG